MTTSAQPHARSEVEAAVAAFVEMRGAIARGEETWTALDRFYTDDAVYVDPAWGRISGGLAEIREFFAESMRDLEDWSFPIEFTAIEGDTVVVTWTQILPGTRPDGSQVLIDPMAVSAIRAPLAGEYPEGVQAVLVVALQARGE